MRTPHSSTYKGKHVRVQLRTGEVFIEKFVERTAKFIVLESRRVRMRDIKAFSILKRS